MPSMCSGWGEMVHDLYRRYDSLSFDGRTSTAGAIAILEPGVAVRVERWLVPNASLGTPNIPLPSYAVERRDNESRLQHQNPDDGAANDTRDSRFLDRADGYQ